MTSIHPSRGIDNAGQHLHAGFPPSTDIAVPRDGYSMEETRIRKRIPKSCRRCHRRKQRCVGSPICSNCQAANTPCLRSDRVPSWHHGMSKGALVQRIEMLESQLASLMDTGAVSDSGSQADLLPVHSDNQGQGKDNETESPTQGSAVMHLLVRGPEYDRGKSTEGPAVADSPRTGKGTYLGPSSGLYIAENISRIIQDAVWTNSIPVNENNEPITTSPYASPPTQTPTPPPDDITGARILSAYFASIHLRLPFVDRAEIHALHAHRHDPPPSPYNPGGGGGAGAGAQFNRFKIYMVYAIGASILKMTETYDSTPPRDFFSTALQFEPSIRSSLSISSIEAMMLLSMYNQQSSASSSLWYIVGQAMRICVDFGLHREAQYARMSAYEAQRHRRLFWSVYLNERSIAWSLGRPFSIPDEEIDAQIPADVDDSVTDDGAVEEMVRNPRDQSDRVEGPNVRCFIAAIKLQRIMARIRTRVYRVDRSVGSCVQHIGPLMEELEAYRGGIPALSPYEDDFVRMHWNSSVRMLLTPFLCLLPPEDKFVATCLRASGAMCQYFKRLRQRDSSWYSFLLVNSVFMAGLTMCLCLFRAPSLWTTSVSNDLRACSSALFVMAERNPNVRKYRDALETVINRVMDYVSDSTNQTAARDISGTAYTESLANAESFMQPIRQAMNQSGLHIHTPHGPGAGSALDALLPPSETVRPFSGVGGVLLEDFWTGDSFGLGMGEVSSALYTS